MKSENLLCVTFETFHLYSLKQQMYKHMVTLYATDALIDGYPDTFKIQGIME